METTTMTTMTMKTEMAMTMTMRVKMKGNPSYPQSVWRTLRTLRTLLTLETMSISEDRPLILITCPSVDSPFTHSSIIDLLWYVFEHFFVPPRHAVVK
jgi:hypothetical protein